MDRALFAWRGGSSHATGSVFELQTVSQLVYSSVSPCLSEASKPLNNMRPAVIVGAVLVLCAAAYMLMSSGTESYDGLNTDARSKTRLAIQLSMSQSLAPAGVHGVTPAVSGGTSLGGHSSRDGQVMPSNGLETHPSTVVAAGKAINAAGNTSRPIAHLSFPPGKPKGLVHITVQDPYLQDYPEFPWGSKNDGVKKQAFLRFENLKRTLRLFDHAFNNQHRRVATMQLFAPDTLTLYALHAFLFVQPLTPCVLRWFCRYPLVIFHQPGLTEETQNTVSSWTKSPLHWVSLDFSRPSHIDAQQMATELATCHKGHVGQEYKHVHRLHAQALYDHKIFEQADYAWRLDDDACLLKRIEEDVFVTMRDGNYTFGHHGTGLDANACSRDLWAAVKAYKWKHKIRPTFLNAKVDGLGDFKEGSGKADDPGIKVFSTGFEISKVSFWRSPQYREWFDYLDKLGGIYTKGWSDAAIKTFALQLFVPPAALKSFETVKFSHPIARCDADVAKDTNLAQFVKEAMA